MSPSNLCALVLAASALGCVDKLPVTPPGTTLFEWQIANATRESVRTATIGARKSFDKKVVVKRASSPFTVDVHIETAEIDFEEGGKKVHQVSPVLLRAKVAGNEKWSLSGKCQDGPHYNMPSVGAAGELVTPQGMIQSCLLKYDLNDGVIFKSRYQLGLNMQIFGDGTISALGDQVKVE